MNDDPKQILDEDEDIQRLEDTTVEPDDFHSSNSSVSTYGEQSMSGTTPDPSSDDDTLENAHEVGLQLDEDSEHPQPLDLGGDIDRAEERIRES